MLKIIVCVFPARHCCKSYIISLQHDGVQLADAPYIAVLLFFCCFLLSVQRYILI